jgi:hypothetical protein
MRLRLSLRLLLRMRCQYWLVQLLPLSRQA